MWRLYSGNLRGYFDHLLQSAVKGDDVAALEAAQMVKEERGFLDADEVIHTINQSRVLLHPSPPPVAW